MFITRLRMALTENELSRICIKEIAGEGIYVIVDVHGLGCCEAKRLINNLINLLYVVLAEFFLKVIHGYRHGTAIRDMLADGLTNSHIHTRFYDVRNKGVTSLLIVS